MLTVDTATIDHISPNGDDRPANMATSCLSCNNKKGNKDLRTFINDVLPEDRRAIAQSNITRITEQIKLPGKGTAKGEKSNDSNGASPSFSEENKLKRIVRQVVQSELSRKRRYEYLTVHIIEKPGYWAWIEDGEETYLQDDNDRPYGTLEDILDEFGDDGWRFVHMITDTSTPYLDHLFTSGKRFLAIFEKAQ